MSVQVHKPYLHGKLIKTPGSVNYRRPLPYFKNLPKDDYGNHHVFNRLCNSVNYI